METTQSPRKWVHTLTFKRDTFSNGDAAFFPVYGGNVSKIHGAFATESDVREYVRRRNETGLEQITLCFV
jgi:hypothetical protein